MRSMSQAEDGVIEAVCHQCLPIVGTMWHPEREKEFAAQDIGRIKVLFRGRKNG